MFLFLSLSTQHLVWIVTGTGIVFSVIFYIGTKELAVRPQRKISKPMDQVVWSNIRYRLLCPRRIAIFLSPCPWTIRNYDKLSQERALVTFLRYCFEWLEHCFIATLFCAENRCCESFLITSPLARYYIDFSC